jgi:hypothetical protein
MSTLSTTRLLQSILASYKVQFPMIKNMATDFSDAPLRLGETVKAHVRVLPSSASYDSTTGYANGANSARSLLQDVDVVVDRHVHVPVLFEHLNNIADQKDSYEGAVSDAAYVLGKSMVDSVCAKFRGSNISRQKAAASANVDLAVLEEIKGIMNTAGASPRGRIGLVNTAVAGTLAVDAKVASRDYYGILTADGEAQGYRVFRNVAGFAAIYEYPDLPGNNAAGRAFTAADTDVITLAAHGFQNGDKVRVSTSAADLPAGLNADTTYYVRDATTNTFKVSLTDGGDAVDITDAGTGTHTVVGWENLTGVFFEASAIALRAGTVGRTDELADLLGIPKAMSFETMQDPNSGFALSLAKWQQPGKGDLFVSPVSIWGSSVGRQAGAASAITDKGAVRLVSAA